MNNKLHVALSPLTNNIYCGKVSKDGLSWLSGKQDVTNAAICAVVDHIIEFKKRTGKDLELSVSGVPVLRVVVEHLENANG